MSSALSTLFKLLLTFTTSFGIAFVTLSLSLEDLTGTTLNWGHLAEKLHRVQSAATELGIEKLGAVSHTIGSFAEPAVTRTLIFSASAEGNGSSPAERSAVLSEEGQGSAAPRAGILETQAARQSSGNLLLQGNIPNFIYYNQHDPRWKDHLYGERDPLDTYGCGPTVLAMLLANTSKQSMLPDAAADWASMSGHHAPGGGSYHSIVSDGAQSFGLDSSPFFSYDPDSVRAELEKGNIFVALMKKGTFSYGSGHFLLLLGTDEHGDIIIADSNSTQNTQKTWPLELLLRELKFGASSGGPLWLVRLS